jgi:hypothetical protein
VGHSLGTKQQNNKDKWRSKEFKDKAPGEKEPTAGIKPVWPKRKERKKRKRKEEKGNKKSQER